jgi:hypothetical protein
MRHVPEQEEEQDECDHNHTEEDPSSPSTPRGITRVIALRVAIITCRHYDEMIESS